MNEKSLLATCLMRLAWSPEQLANEINKKYGTGTISSKAPYNWLKGARPRRRLPYVVAQILSDRLREPITVEALWPQHVTAAQDPAAQAAGFRSSGTSGAAEPGPDLMAAAVDWLVAGEADAPSRLRGDELPAVAVDLLTTRI